MLVDSDPIRRFLLLSFFWIFARTLALYQVRDQIVVSLELEISLLKFF